LNEQKKIIFSVTNALNYDQRMYRICNSLHQAGFMVSIIGWELFNSPELIPKPYNQHRIRIYFQQGKLRYIEYNLKLYFWLLKNKADAICAIDLDTISPCYWAAKWQKAVIVYDAHEYFTELEEVVRRPFVKKIWTAIEKYYLPKIKYGYAVCQSYIDQFKIKYNVDYFIVRNATILLPIVQKTESGKPNILYQGAVNEGRALKQAIEAMQYVNATLIICGEGDLYATLKTYSEQLAWANKIEFKGFVLPQELINYTRQATIGLTLFENNGLSNYYSLANRFFDYMHSAVPQVCINFPEYKIINEDIEIAHLINNTSTLEIAQGINHLLEDVHYYNKLKQNCIQAREKYNWQIESKKLIEFYNRILNNG
jgi:glycosyltransferase involved in cell wall biosynthesis